jgi:hypothetical protein
VFRRVVRLEYARLTLIGLRESVAALLPHALDLAHFADGFLELFHSKVALVKHGSSLSNCVAKSYLGL